MLMGCRSSQKKFIDQKLTFRDLLVGRLVVVARGLYLAIHLFTLLGILAKCIFLSLLELVLPRWTSRCFGEHFLCLSGNGAPSRSHLLPLACPSVATDEVVSDWKPPSSAASGFGQDRLLSGFSNRQHESIHLCGRSPAYQKKWIRKSRWVKRNTSHLFL